MGYQLFLERLLRQIKAEREVQKDELARGYGEDDYKFRVGRLRGYDDVEAFCASIAKNLTNGEE